MKVLLISGFLGSGKTTLLIHIAKRFISLKKSVVIVENEIGEIGIDGSYISHEGLAIQELYGGCVCCTLSGDMRNTLVKIHGTIKPDVVLIEPTGAAYPGDIVTNVLRPLAFIEEYRTVVLIDPSRYQMLREMMTPLLDAQLGAADVIAINKIDETEEVDIELIVSSIPRIIKDRKPIVKISAEKQINTNELFERVF